MASRPCGDCGVRARARAPSAQFLAPRHGAHWPLTILVILISRDAGEIAPYPERPDLTRRAVKSALRRQRPTLAARGRPGKPRRGNRARGAGAAAPSPAVPP